MKFYRVIIYILVLTIVFSSPISLGAETIAPPVIRADTAVLMDVETGKVLFDKDSTRRMFPASTTKILTALVAIEYLNPEDYLIVGDELHYLPLGSSRAGHEIGETLLVDNALTLLMVPSGNDTAIVIAMAVARISLQDNYISYTRAEAEFSALMNAKAESLGATGSNFTNPHGFHDVTHYSTARDLALITKAAMEYPILARIFAETDFRGPGAGDNPPEGAHVVHYTRRTYNELLLPGPYNYPYAIGVKTGFTNEAGHSLVSAARRDGRTLICVVLFSTEFERFTDSRALFEYGFAAYEVRTVQTADTQLENVPVSNPRLGDTGYVRTRAAGYFSMYMSYDELSRVERTIEYDENLVVAPEDIILPEEGSPPRPAELSETTISTPVAVGDVIGQIFYTLDGEIIFQDDIIALDYAEERTTSADFDYQVDRFREWLFSAEAIPYWAAVIGGFMLIIIIIVAIVRAKRRKARRRGRYSF